jgi:hypothetical protein
MLSKTQQANLIKKGMDILSKKGELLTLVRYHGEAGNRDFLIIRSAAEFDEFFNKRSPRDSITFFKSFSCLRKGIVNSTFIDEALRILSKPDKREFLVIWDKSGGWFWAENLEQLEEELEEEMGQSVQILAEPDWFNEEKAITIYVPDEDGVIRPGIY